MLVKRWSLGRAFAWGMAVGFAFNLASHPPNWHRLTDQMVADAFFGGLGAGAGFGLVFAAVAAVRNRVAKATV